MRYARREPRVKVACGVTLKLERPPLVLGEATDLSLHGMGVLVTRPLSSGTAVEITLDADMLPDVTVSTMTATVVASRRDEELYRLGLAVADLPSDLVEYVRDVATPTRMIVVNEDSIGLASGPSRELLYQAAWARLGSSQFEGALSAAERALAGDPENRLYRAMVCRVAAEWAIARGRVEDAFWNLMKAHAYAPRDPEILSLLDRVRAPILPPAWPS